MSELEEGLIIVGVYLFFLSGVTIWILMAYFSVRIHRIIKRADKIVKYIDENEEEARKYRG